MDAADRAQIEIERVMARVLERERVELAPGVEGDCELCGEWAGRLIGGVCAPCRDRYGLP